ncbi:BppU family phage baseplate upper protein [Enterococcus lactis]|uniref:BppU family phage baseplate upper protein n=1 Tax=Enterococcus TaxID=1350 RepID=UPI0037F32549
MASSLYNLALDFSKELNYTKAIMARQGDKGITVTVKPFLNGLQMDTSGGTFTLKGTTPSNRYVDSVATSVTSEEVTFSLDGTFMSEAGYYKHCYVEYRKDDQILTTQDIIFFSLGVSDISQGQADEYVSQLEELIRKYNETFDAFMAEIKGRVDSLNQQITDLTGQAKTLQDKLDALKEEISKLGNLQVMYSNSIDFGGHDYSGRPNLFLNLDFSKLSKNASAITEPPAYVKDGGSHFVLDFSDPSANGVDRHAFIPAIGRLEKGATYIATVPIMISDDFSTAYGASPIYPYCVSANNVETRVTSLYPDNSCRGKWGFIKKTFTVPANVSDGEFTYFQVYSTKEQVGKLYIGYDIKIEKVTSTSDTATPYQPNLLDAPYYLSKVPLGENILKPASFPINTTEYMAANFTPNEPYVKGQKYTFTMKASKPSTQTFGIYLRAGSLPVGNMVPVEGLADVWQLTFEITQSHIDGSANALNVFQAPQSTKGTVNIEWAKLEKGDTRTPNIEQYKYRGIGMRDSNNPKDYVWDLEPEYVEDNLATDVKISEITGKANNYTDGKVSEINSQLTASIHAVDTAAKDAQTKANANATAIKSTNSRVDEIENNLYVLGEWKTLPLENGYTGADGTTPQYRVNLVNGHRNVVFNGAISTIAGTLPSQGQQHNASTLPTELIPSGTKMGLGATSLFTTSCRLAVTGKGTLYIGNDSGKDVKYCYLDLFSYWLD